MTERGCFLQGNCRTGHKIIDTAKNIINFACFVCLCILGCAELVYPFWEEWDSRVPHPGEAYVGPTGVSLPYGRILLARKDKEYCTIRYSKYWEKNKGKECYASYESFYQGDGSGDFSKINVKHKKGEVSDFGPGMFLGLFHTWGGDSCTSIADQ